MTTPTPSMLHRSILKTSNNAMRAYLQKFPIKAGKLWVWNHIGRPYLAWRDFPVVATTRQGISVKGPLSDTIHGSIFFFGVWEPALSTYLIESLAPGDVVIDIGANVGVHTMLAAQRVGPSGRVHAIEASPTIAGMLRANLARNSIDNVTVHNIAVSDGAGMTQIFLHDTSNLGASSTLKDAAESAAERPIAESIEMKALPDIVPTPDLLRARIIKIDVEGAEWSVLQGLWSLLPSLRDDVSIVVEVNRRALMEQGVSVAQLLETFRNHGYTAFGLQSHSAAACIEGPATDWLPVETDFDMADLVFRKRQTS